MRLLIAISLLCVFYSGASHAQTELDRSNEYIQFTPKELAVKRVDSLVKYVRKQFYQNNFGQTIAVGEQTLKLAREIDNYKAIFRVSSLMGNAFLKLDDTIQAKRIFQRTIREAEKKGDTTRGLTTARIDLGNLYSLEQKNTEAIQQYKEAVPLAEKLTDTTHLFILNYNIADLSLKDKNLDASEEYVAKTNIYAKKVKADAYQAVAQSLNGRLYYLKQEPQKAIPYLEKSIILAEKSGYREALIETYEVYANVQTDLKNYKAANELLSKADVQKSEKYKTDKIQAIEMVTAKFKLNEYQQELKAKTLQNAIDQQETKRKTTVLWIKIASGILLLFSIFLLLSFLKRKKLLKDLIKKNSQYLKAKEESEQLTEAKTILFSKITHELRTPLYGIIGISSLLLDDDKLDHQTENVTSLKFSADYLLSLINNVLQFTQLESAGAEMLKHTPLNVRDLVTSVAESSKFLNTSTPNIYEIQVDTTIPEVLMGDDIKLSQILMNLVSNATKFTHNGTITIRVDRKADKNKMVCLHFSIQDTGVGISKERQAHIFDEFAETESDYEHQGTGLGLPIVKKLLELHNSEIILVSSPNEGTCVSFELCYAVAPHKENNGSRKQGTGEPFAGKKILVVDDNKINQLVTKKTLEKQGATVLVVSDGKQAIALARAESLDLILMDINMPHMNGFEATQWIRTFNQEIPIIALTAVEEEKIRVENTTALLNDFIIKPYNSTDFVNKILKHINP